jgi:hypothetical protein
MGLYDDLGTSLGAALVRGLLGLEKPSEPHESCTEPGGNDDVAGDSAHDTMIELTGQCPWCGTEEGT